MSDNRVLFWSFVGCAVVFVLVLAAACGFVYFYLWALGKLLIVVLHALAEATESIARAVH